MGRPVGGEAVLGPVMDIKAINVQLCTPRPMAFIHEVLLGGSWVVLSGVLSHRI